MWDEPACQISGAESDFADETYQAPHQMPYQTTPNRAGRILVTGYVILRVVGTVLLLIYGLLCCLTGQATGISTSDENTPKILWLFPTGHAGKTTTML